MPRVYPRAPEIQVTPAQIDEVVCAERIAQCKDADMPKAVAAGICLAGSDDVVTFERLWSEIDAQVISARAVSPADHATVTLYKAAVSEAAPLLDSTLWYDGLKAEVGVSTYAELVSKVEELSEISLPKGL